MVLAGNPVHERIRGSHQLARRGGGWDLTFNAMATRCRVVFEGGTAEPRSFADEVLDWISEFEARYSRFLPESLISEINRAAGRDWVEIDLETERLFGLCQELNFITRGILDPTALPLLRIWDWKLGLIPSERQISEALDLVGWRKLQRKPGRVFLPKEGMGIDLGGVGKEYAVDQVVQMAIERELSSVLVDFGQDVRVHGEPPDKKPFWHIGLEEPARPGSCWAGLGLREGAVATSGDYVRSFRQGDRRYGHIIDPRTGYPVQNGSLAVSVIAPNCSVAGALATAAFVMGHEEGVALIDAICNAEGCVVSTHGRRASRRFYEYVASESKQR